MKKIFLTTLLMIVFLLNGCASDSTETQIESYDTQETLQVNKKEFSNRAGSDCTIKEFKLPLPENADISCFCYSSPYIYYGISYTFYKESMLTVGKEFVYSDDYATQIRRYDVQTKKDILLYQYDNCVEISDIQSDGDAVIWEDYLGEDGTWRVVKQSKDKNDIQLLFSAKDTQSTMDAVTLKEKDGSVYWYDRSENNGKYGLYQYADKNISILNDDISLASPFQHVTLDGNKAVKIYTDADEKIQIRVGGKDIDTGIRSVSDVQINDQYVVWHEENIINKIYVYDRKAKQIYMIETDDFFSYGMLKHTLIVNGSAGVLVYDLDQETDTVIKPASQNTNMYLYIFQGQDCLYTQRVDDQSVIGVLEYNGGTDRNSTLSDGWNVSGNAIVYGGKTICQISDVDDRADTIDLCAIDSKKAFVSYFSNDDRISVMNCTADGKQTKLASLEYKSYGGPNAVYLNFTNDKQGYLLYCSDPGAGMMNKVLWSTDDGGNTYTVVKDLSAAIQNYPTDMAFKDASTGMILVSNHGADAYAYMTEDAGKTWKPYEIDTFKKCNYVNGISIEKNADSTWNLLLQIATDDGLDSVTYTSDDEWKTWNRKEK